MNKSEITDTRASAQIESDEDGEDYGDEGLDIQPQAQKGDKGQDGDELLFGESKP